MNLKIKVERASLPGILLYGGQDLIGLELLMFMDEKDEEEENYAPFELVLLLEDVLDRDCHQFMVVVFTVVPIA